MKAWVTCVCSIIYKLKIANRICRLLQVKASDSMHSFTLPFALSQNEDSANTLGNINTIQLDLQGDTIHNKTIYWMVPYTRDRLNNIKLPLYPTLSSKDVYFSILSCTYWY